MNQDLILETITEELCTHRGCHTVILYGSRARGDQTTSSDYDIFAIRPSGEIFRDARLWNGIYLDIFVYPEVKIMQPQVDLLRLRHAKVLREKDGLGTKLLAQVEQMDLAGPKKLAIDEITARRTWYKKALDRVRCGGVQGNLRRMELLPMLLEDYFTTRAQWFRGSKESFAWLKVHRPDLYDAFTCALEPTAEISSLETLILLIDAEIEKEAKPAEILSKVGKPKRPSFIKHWRELQDEDNASYPGSDELLAIGSALGKKLGLTRIGLHHEWIPPGRRTSWPHAESAEEEFGFVIEGHPDVWIDGTLHGLDPGDMVAFPAGSGIAHTFINNTNDVVRMIVGGESSKTENQIYYAKHPEVQERRKDWWVTHPIHPMGPHDGLPDMLRLKQSALTTARLELEPIQLSHAKELWELFSDLRLHEFVPTEPPTLEAQQQRCMRWSRGRSPDGAEIWINWAARDKMSGSLIGHFQVGIKTDGTATIGYTVANHFQGKGYATEALRGVFDLLQDKFQVIKINASADTRNLASHRLAEKLGMKKVATIKGADFFKGKASDEYVFSLDVKNE